MGIEELEEAVRELLDIEEIKRVHAKYAYHVDSQEWDQVVELFTEDAVADWGGSRGRFEGKEEIARFFKENVSRSATMLRHMMIQPLIEVEGDRAKARLYLFSVGTYKLPQGDTAMWTQGEYRNELVRQGGRWRISRLNFEATFRTPYHDGWVKTPKAF